MKFKKSDLDETALPKTDIIKYIVLGIFISIFAFPEIDSLSYGPGIDPPLVWAFNYFFERGLELGKGIIFPHGPLCFFTYPLANNILFALVIRWILQLHLVVNIFLISRQNDKENWLAPVLVSLILLKFWSFTILLAGLIMSAYLLHAKNRINYFSYMGIFLTAFAFYVKTYIAVISGILTFCFIGIYLLKKREYRFAALNLGLWGLFVCLFWVLMYGTFKGLPGYVTGMMHLSMDNSSAASYYPLNDWFYLTIFISILLLLPFIQKTRSGWVYAAIVALSLFAAWKHGMARQDMSHVRGFVFYVAMSMCLFLLYISKNWFMNLSLLGLAFFSLCSNWKNALNYEDTLMSFTGVTHFNTFREKYGTLKSEADKRSEAAVRVNALPAEVLKDIGTAPVDVYPWDLSVIPANQLNWQPRPVIQSYAAYTSWLDKQNAVHFKSEKAPEYIIWRDDKGIIDINGGTMESIDNRYLLNDEPQTIIQMLNRYALFYKDNDFFIFKKQAKENLTEPVVEGETETTWNNWLPVPPAKDGILRARVYIRGNMGRVLKSFFYKDEEFYIYYYLNNGDIRQYKIVPKNAEDGVWINPFIADHSKNYYDPIVEKIQLRCSNKKLMDEKIKIVWERMNIVGSAPPPQAYHSASALFGKNKQKEDDFLFSSTNDCEGTSICWSSDSSNLKTENFYSGKHSSLLKPGAFSFSLKISLDSLLKNKETSLFIKTSGWVKGKKTCDVAYITVIGNDQNTILWKGAGVKDFIIDETDWNHIVNATPFNYIPGVKPTNLVVYFWNTGTEEILIDDLKVTVERNTH